KIIIIRLQALGWFAQSPRHFSSFKLRRQCAYHARRHLILQIEDVFERAVVAVGPDVIACCGVNELSSDADAIAGLADASLQHISDAELAADLLQIDRLALVG